MGHSDTEKLRNSTIRELTETYTAAVMANVRTGHAQTLHDLDNAFGSQLADEGFGKLLLRAAACCGPLEAGNLVLSIMKKCIAADAECAAIKEVERMESHRHESAAGAQFEQRVWAKGMRNQSVFGGLA